MPEISAPAASAAPPKSTSPAAPTKPSAPPSNSSGGALPSTKPDDYADAFSELDGMDSGKPALKKEAAKIPPSRTGADAKESDTNGEASNSQEEPSAQDAEDTTDESKSSGSTTQPAESKPVKAKELRQAYESLKQKISGEYEPKIKQYEAKIKELETRPPEDAAKVNERVQTLEKRNSELEEHIKFVDYQKSSEYQDKFWKPYVKAWEDAKSELKGLQVKYEDRESGEEKTREITEADLQYLANLDPAARRTEINRLFPDDKEEVKRHIGEIRRLAEASDKALEEARKSGTEKVKQTEEQQRAAQATRARLWKEVNTGLAEKYPAWFAPTEGDDEGNKVLARGTALANLMFSPQDLKVEDIDMLPKAFSETLKARKPLTVEQMTQLHAIAYNKFRNHDRLALKLKASKARIAELEKNLKEYENSEPNNLTAGNRTPGNGESWTDNWQKELDELDRKAR